MKILVVAALLAITSATPASAAPVTAASETPAAAPTRFSVVVEGEGPDVIMIPGLVSGRAVWDDAVASLEGRYRIHRLQLAGFAGEPARGNAEGEILPGVVEELHAYIEAQGLERPALVGHSLGGLIALMLADAHPDSVGKLLVVDALPFYGMMFGPEATAETVQPRAAAFRDILLGMSEESYRAQQPATMARLVKSEAARPALVEQALASDRSVAASAVYEDMITDMRPELPSLHVPLTVVYAVNDFAPEQTYGALYRSGYAGAPDVTFEPVRDSYHFVMLDRPARFNAILADFLTGEE